MMRKIACVLFHFMYAYGWCMTYAYLAFCVFGDAIIDHEAVTLIVSAIAGCVSGGLLYVYILKEG